MFKKFIILTLVFIIFSISFSLAEAADRYWVGGTGGWTDDDNHWSDSSGGAPADGNLPTASDNCIFDTNSRTPDAAYTVTISTGVAATCLDFTMDGPGSGFNVTWASSGFPSLTISGSMNLIGGSTDITRTYNGQVIFNATSGTKTITSNGISLPSTVTFDGVGGTWQLSDAFSASGGITLTNGSFISNNQTIAGSINSSNSNIRSITLGSSTINGGANCIYFFNSTNLTFDSGTSTLNCTGGNFRGGGQTFNNVVFTTSGSATTTMSGVNTFNDLTFTGSAAEESQFILENNIIVSGVFTVNGNSAIYRTFVQSDTSGTPRTITTASVSASNADFQDIVGAGAGDWDLSGIVGRSGDCGDNSGITFSTPSTRYWVGGTGDWSDTAMWSSTSGGASGASVPLCSDNVIFDSNSFDTTSETVTGNMSRLGADISFTGVTNNPTISFAGKSIYGSLTLVSGMDVIDSDSLYLKGRGTETLTFGGNTPPMYLYIEAVSGAYTLADDLNIDYDLTLNSGTFDANNFNVTAFKFYSSTSNTRTLTMGSGTWELTGAGNFWDLNNAENLTLNAETSTIKSTDTSVDERSFYGGGKIYYNFWSDAGISLADLRIDGSNTFTDFKDTGTVAHDIVFTNGTTQTVSTFNVSGTLGNLITLNSDNNSDTFALVKSGGGTISSDYLNIQHSVATPADTWYAGLNSVDNQLVAEAGSGWTFTEPPVVEETSNSSSGSTRRFVATQPIPAITPIPQNLALECLPEHKFSNITGLPCPITVEVNTPSVPQNEDSDKFIFTKSLWTQMIDPDVKELQKYLNTHGYPVALTGVGSLGNETTKFGNLTRDALIKFQIANNITPAIGFFGPITRAVVNAN